MKALGIDFGSKRVGLAISTGDGRVAVPMRIVGNTPELAKEIETLCRELSVDHIVIGESLDYKGNPNLIMKKIRPFMSRLRKLTKVHIEFEPELLTSAQAARIQGKTELLDASAAAIILQTWLDKHNHSHPQQQNGIN